MNKKCKLCISVLLFFLFVLTITSASAGDIKIGDNESTYTTVSEAVNNSQNGDVIYIGTGNYNENNIQINHDLTISAKDNSQVTLNANQGKLFTVEKNAKLTLIGITFINGKSDYGSIIYNNGQTNIKNCTFSNCEVDSYGGVIFNNLGTLNVKNSTFKNNTANGQGGFLHNEAGNVKITDSIFINNQAARGGAIYNHHGFLTVDNSKFQKNNCGKNGELGGAIKNWGPATITNSIFENNNGAMEGGAIYNFYTTLNVKNCKFTNNTANHGQAIENIQNALDPEKISIRNCEFTNNGIENQNEKGNIILNHNTILNSTISGKNVDYPYNWLLVSNNLVKYYKNDTKFVVNTLASENVIFEINGKNYTRTSDENGLASIAINLRPGNYTMKTYTFGSVLINNITILSTINAQNIVKMYKNGTQFHAKFLKSDGTPLANTNVTFNINGVFYSRQTNTNGSVTLNINLRPGTYVLTAIDPITGLDLAYTVTVLPTIIAKNIVKTYNNATQFHATLLNEKGNPVANTNITLNINGVYYHRTTNESGIATLNINLMPGKYILTAIDPFNKLSLGYDVTVLEKD